MTTEGGGMDMGAVLCLPSKQVIRSEKGADGRLISTEHGA